MFSFNKVKKKKEQPVAEENDETADGAGGGKHKKKKRSRRMEQFKSFCTKLTTFLFSRVGLCFVVVGYVAVGGFIFRSIEGRYEEEKAQNKSLIYDIVNHNTETLISEIWNMTKFELVFHERNYTNKLKSKLVDYQKNLSDAIKEGYKGQAHYNVTKWTYPGSILYSVTIVTTIGIHIHSLFLYNHYKLKHIKGYGHITCETDAGKVATIVYAIIGIPMMLLCLANIGSSMANFFRFLYARVCCGYCNYVKKRNIRQKAATLSTVAVTHGNTISYAALATTNLVINQENGPPTSQLGVSNDNTAFYTNAPPTPDVNASKNLKIPDVKFEKSPLPGSVVDGSIRAATVADPNIVGLLEESNIVDYKKITVPISITLFILSSYILLGGVLFKTLENWTTLDGVYFCFITLSTIGLGDYVPGNSINDTDTQSELKLVGCSLYLLMGLSLIAMCFNLMQEEVTAKFRRLAVRLGIIDDPNYW